jgi:hypothetical protein
MTHTSETSGYSTLHLFIGENSGPMDGMGKPIFRQIPTCSYDMFPLCSWIQTSDRTRRRRLVWSGAALLRAVGALNEAVASLDVGRPNIQIHGPGCLAMDVGMPKKIMQINWVSWGVHGDITWEHWDIVGNFEYVGFHQAAMGYGIWESIMRVWRSKTNHQYGMHDLIDSCLSCWLVHGIISGHVRKYGNWWYSTSSLGTWNGHWQIISGLMN